MRAFLLSFILLSSVIVSCDMDRSNHRIPDRPVLNEDFYQASLKSINTTIDKNPDNPEAYFRKAQILKGLGKYNNAILTLEKAIKLKEKEVDYHMLLTELYSQNKEYAKANAAALRAEQLGENSAVFFARIAYINEISGSFDRALHYVNKALMLAADDASLHLRKGMIALKSQDTTAAKSSLIRSLQYDTTWLEPYQLLTDIYIAEQKYDTAMVYLQKNLQANPTDPMLVWQEAAINKMRGNTEAAKNTYRKYIQLAGEGPEVLKNMADLFVETKQIDSARLYAERWQQLVPKAVAPLLYLARIDVSGRRYVSAKERYTAVLTLDSGNLAASKELQELNQTLWKIERSRLPKRTEIEIVEPKEIKRLELPKKN